MTEQRQAQPTVNVVHKVVYNTVIVNNSQDAKVEEPTLKVNRNPGFAFVNEPTPFNPIQSANTSSVHNPKVQFANDVPKSNVQAQNREYQFTPWPSQSNNQCSNNTAVSDSTHNKRLKITPKPNQMGEKQSNLNSHPILNSFDINCLKDYIIAHFGREMVRNQFKKSFAK